MTIAPSILNATPYPEQKHVVNATANIAMPATRSSRNSKPANTANNKTKPNNKPNSKARSKTNPEPKPHPEPNTANSKPKPKPKPKPKRKLKPSARPSAKENNNPPDWAAMTPAEFDAAIAQWDRDRERWFRTHPRATKTAAKTTATETADAMPRADNQPPDWGAMTPDEFAVAVAAWDRDREIWYRTRKAKGTATAATSSEVGGTMGNESSPGKEGCVVDKGEGDEEKEGMDEEEGQVEKEQQDIEAVEDEESKVEEVV